jgi:nucleoside-diphosphate-sugar epimerase
LAKDGTGVNKALSKLRGKSVLITGGLGFIGSNLAQRLVEAGCRVTLVDSLIDKYGGNLFNVEPIRDRVWVNISDVRDPFAFSYLIRDQDVVFNLAGQTSHVDSMSDPEIDLEINVRAQLSILEACRKHNPGAKIVFASTRQIYGRPQYLPVDEAHPLIPVDVNGINKMAGEHYHLLYQRVYGLKTAVLRLTNTYGPRMRVKDARQTFLGIWIKELIEGRPIKVFGTGEQLRDFNYVDDAIDALLIAATNDAAIGEIFNLGGPERISLKSLADLMIQANGAGSYEVVPFPPERKAIDIGDYYGDYTKAERALGWRPAVPLAEGLRRSLDYFREHRRHYWEN